MFYIYYAIVPKWQDIIWRLLVIMQTKTFTVCLQFDFNRFKGAWQNSQFLYFAGSISYRLRDLRFYRIQEPKMNPSLAYDMLIMAYFGIDLTQCVSAGN